MGTPVENFGLVTVSTGYGAGDTSVALTTGDGSRLPDSFPYPMTWWNATDYAAPADDPNREIVSVTNRSTDTLTVARAQEGTSASSKNTGGKTYRMSLGITKAMWEDLRVNKSTHHGVVLRTDRDSTDSLKKVELVTCDYIVMDDGVALRNDSGEWSGKTADITVAGTGGLDTGTEDSVAWYEIYAIAKEDGTRNLLLHKSHIWRYDTFNTTGEDSGQAVRAATANTYVAQGFQLFDSAEIMAITLRLSKAGSPTGVMGVIIYSDSAGLPNVALLQSHYLDVSRLTGDVGDVIFTFPRTGTVLSGSTQYHVMLYGNWAINGTDYVEWRMDGSAGTYAEGSKSLWNGSAWSAVADDDMIFSIIIEYGVNSLVYPSGYTKKCLLGWVYNDGSSNFVPFIQRGTTRRTAHITSDNSRAHSCDGTAQAYLFGNFVPPLECVEVIVGATGTGTQAGIIAVGSSNATDISITGESTGAQAVILSSTIADRPVGATPIFLERGLAMINGTDGSDLYVVGFSW